VCLPQGLIALPLIRDLFYGFKKTVNYIKKPAEAEGDWRKNVKCNT